MGFDTSGLLPLSDALQGMLAQLACCCDSEQLPLPEALGRVLASDIASPLAVPPFDNSAMDGYAVRLADIAAGIPLIMAGKAFAGQPYQGEWLAGHCVRIMTGAPVPAGTDAVVMQEETQADGDRITFLTQPEPGQNIRRAGSDIGKGACVLQAGTRLTPREMPLLASLGVATVTVRRPLKVAIFSTGDELKPVGTPLAHGDIYDSNRYGVRAMLARMGCDCLDLGIIPDDPAQLRAAFIRADEEADVLITTGGVSVGKRTSPNNCWTSSARLASGSWPSSRASRLPLAVCPAPGSSACRATPSPPWSPSISWCNRRWPSWRASSSSARSSCKPLRPNHSKRARADSTSSAAS